MASVAPSTARGVDHRHAARCTVAAEVAALQRLHDGLNEQFDVAAQALVDIRGKLITLGVGKSGLAACACTSASHFARAGPALSITAGSM